MRTCVCGNIIPCKIRIDGIVRNLKNRTRCLTCVPFGQSRYRVKGVSGRTRRGNEMAQYVRRFIAAFGIDPITARRRTHKNAIIQLIGGSCQFCGYNRLFRNLAFHHIEQKAFPLSEREFGHRAEIIIPEVMKCIVVCHNCHGEVHEGVIDTEVIARRHRELQSVIGQLSGKGWDEIVRLAGLTMPTLVDRVGLEPTASP